MRVLKKIMSLCLLLSLMFSCTSFGRVNVSATEFSETINISENEIETTNGITKYYKVYCYDRNGKYINSFNEYWRSNAFESIWGTSGSYKGYVLEDSKGANSYTNCAGVGLEKIKIDFNTYYQLGLGHSKNNSSYVNGVQQALSWLGYNIGSTGADGDFGPATEKAVIQFQKNHGLTPDGIVGKQTYFELARATY